MALERELKDSIKNYAEKYLEYALLDKRSKALQSDLQRQIEKTSELERFVNSLAPFLPQIDSEFSSRVPEYFDEIMKAVQTITVKENKGEDAKMRDKKEQN